MEGTDTTALMLVWLAANGLWVAESTNILTVTPEQRTALTAAAIATKKLKVGTGVCLVIQRDTIPSLSSMIIVFSGSAANAVEPAASAAAAPYSSVRRPFSPVPMASPVERPSRPTASPAA